MNFRKLPATSLVLTLLPAILIQLPAGACGPFFDYPDFSYTLHPDLPLSKFAAGNLGVLKPTMARSYLYVAWRYLNNVPLTPTEQKSVVALWDQRLKGEDPDQNKILKTWDDVRAKAGIKKKSDVYPVKTFSGDTYFAYTNCPNDAFTSAVKTAKQVTDQFGPGSKELKDWFSAQDKVFCNCNGGFDDKKTIPPPVPADLSAKLKPYRDYQVASANFYAGNYDLAREQFKKIAADPQSPFKSLGSYLALRAEVRKAVIAKTTDNALLSQTEAQIKKLMKEENTSAMHSALEDLLAFVRFKIDQRGRFSELARILSKPASNITNDLCDYTFLFDNLLGESSEYDAEKPAVKPEQSAFIKQSGDVSDWILTFQGREKDAASHAHARWNETHALPWLVAAITLEDAKSPDCAKLMEDAHKIGKSSHAYQHLQYEIVKKTAAQGKKDEACKLIESILSDRTFDLPPSSKNMFVNERLMLSKDFSDFTGFALQRPACLESGWESGVEKPVDFDKMEESKTYTMVEPAFAEPTARFLNSSVPLNLLSKLPLIAGLPAKLKSDILQALWVRAFLLNDTSTISSVSPDLKKSVASLAPMIASYENAKTPEEKSFAAAFMFVSNPGMRPVITYGYGRLTSISKIDDFQDNWWQKNDLLLSVKSVDEPAKNESNENSVAAAYLHCLNAKQKSEGIAESKKIVNLGLAPAVLCRDILAYARKSPQDARIPQALSLAVKATHFGERDASTTKLSKECFSLLHSKYPKNPWTAKTKFYY